MRFIYLALWHTDGTGIIEYDVSYDEKKNTTVPVRVNVSIAIIDMIKIEEIDHIFTLKETSNFLLKYNFPQKMRGCC